MYIVSKITLHLLQELPTTICTRLNIVLINLLLYLLIYYDLLIGHEHCDNECFNTTVIGLH